MPEVLPTFMTAIRAAQPAVWAMAAALMLAACASLPRQQFTKVEAGAAVIPGIPGARIFTDEPAAFAQERAQLVLAGMPKRQITLLALSGGGADAAFGAGVLNGWTASGTRPQFSIVSGTSAGALVAPFAFLGPAYDAEMKAVFTNGEAEKLLQVDGLNAIFGTAVFKAEPLRQLVARHVDENLLAAVAAEYRKGRRLFVVTTHLDAQRTAVWDMGAIAASGHPRALGLFRDVLVASSSIPGVFAPVMIDVEGGGRQFAEMHVDGGVTANVLAVPQSMLLSTFPRSGAQARIYVIVNGKLAPEFNLVKDQTLPIVARAFLTTVKANTRNTLIATRDFARRNGLTFNLAEIDPDYPAENAIGFKTAYMAPLFDYGFAKGRSGRAFHQDLPEALSERRVAAQ
jgi:predicted acylesterase/phospholipase RssA